MGDDDERRAVLFGEAQHRVEHFLRGVRVEVAGRLVGKQARGLGDHGAGEGAALALAAGELARQVRKPLAETDLGEHALCAVEGILALRAADEKRHGDVLDRGELRQQVMELVDEAERRVPRLAALGFAHLAVGAPLHEHLAGGRRIERAEEMQQGRLARARATHDGHALGAMDLEVDAVEHRHRLRSLVGFSQRAAGDDRLALIHSAMPRPDSCARRSSSGRASRRRRARAPSG